uniref:protein RoBo-1-like n=1 Tax=Pristiophorus japonicus TaxID=55135 RepID=UPI00398E7547
MGFPLAVLIVSSLLGPAAALKCYECSRSVCDPIKDAKTCKDGEVCMTGVGRHRFATGVLERTVRSCVASVNCTNISLNLGAIIRGISCCNTDLCNTGPVEKMPSNKLQCIGCLQMLNDFKCNLTGSLKCTGNQTKCGRLHTVLSESGRNKTIDFQGCMSESVCQLKSTQILFDMELGESFQCCDGKLCNGASRVATIPLCLVILSIYLLASINK